MGDRAREIEAYELAAKIADRLLVRGIPVIRFGDSDMGAKVAMAFQLDNERAVYATRLPVEEASVERFEELYRAVA